MSTLGRKAMKKTLERLKEDALTDVENCLSVFKKQWDKIDELSKEKKDLLNLLTEYTPRAIISLLRYVQGLEAYGYELDEEWDKLLERSRKAQEQSQAVQKEGKKKPSYRV